MSTAHAIRDVPSARDAKKPFCPDTARGFHLDLSQLAMRASSLHAASLARCRDEYG
jgi:hypothetical protein